MKKLVRGGLVLLLVSMFVAIIYAQTATQTEDNLIIANDSQVNSENTIAENIIDNTTSGITTNSVDLKADDKDEKAAAEKKLVKTTAMVSAAGASKGAFSASAYCFSGRTAMGHGVRRGLIAADPRVLRLGSKVYINAGQWSGTYLVSDTGGAIKGKRIDIWVPSCSEARKFGRRSVQVFAAQ
jgi:3D (Asp-Asp-Asp) domain-containing protein